jgi:hypothetical protein
MNWSLQATGVKWLPGGASDHLDLHRIKCSKRGGDGITAVKGDLNRSMSSENTSASTLLGWKLHQPHPFQTQKQFVIGHGLEHTVSLPPVPKAAKLSGNECPTLNLMLFNNGADEGNITVSDPSAPDYKLCIHGPLYNIVFLETSAFFQKIFTILFWLNCYKNS